MSDTNDIDDGTTTQPSTAVVAVPTQAITLSIPTDVAPKQAALSRQADDTVKAVLADPFNRALQDSLANIGLETQQSGQVHLDRFNVQTRDLAKMGDKRDAGIMGDIAKLRTQMTQLNPYVTGIPKYARMLDWIPGWDPLYKRLQDIGAHAESIEANISAVVKSLRQQEEGQKKDAEELAHLYDSTNTWVSDLRANRILAGMVYNRLLEELAKAADPNMKNALVETLTDVQLRYEAIAKMIVIAEQDLTVMDQRIRFAKRLVRRIETTIATAPQAVTVALAIKVEHYRQRSVSASLDSIDEYTLQITEATAKDLNQDVEDMRQQVKRGLQAIGRLLAAQQEIVTSLDNLERAQVEYISSGKQSLAQLEEAADALRARRERQVTERDAVKSLEAAVS
jgi:uncharacterized protein YaaN involved in tellurite resistance